MKKALLTPVLALFSVVLIAQVSSKEKEALLDLYVATNGDSWNQSWDLSTPVSNWQGVTVTNNRVTGIRLLFNKLKGELPASIGNLEHLKTLELSFNEISGSLPESLSLLQNLEVLAFNGNDLTGEIPASIEKLENLKQLHLSSNYLVGTVPTGIDKLSNLEVFNVFDNDLTGDLPAKMASNRKLREFMIAENSFTNTEIFSVVLMSQSGQLNLNQHLVPASKKVMALESEEIQDN